MIDLLCDTLWQHDHDSRIKDNKRKVVQLYFPYVLLLIERLDWVANLPPYSEERRKALACFIYIIKGTADHVLESYWKRETERRISCFFKILQMAIEEFEVC